VSHKDTLCDLTYLSRGRTLRDMMGLGVPARCARLCVSAMFVAVAVLVVAAAAGCGRDEQLAILDWQTHNGESASVNDCNFEFKFPAHMMTYTSDPQQHKSPEHRCEATLMFSSPTSSARFFSVVIYPTHGTEFDEILEGILANYRVTGQYEFAIQGRRAVRITGRGRLGFPGGGGSVSERLAQDTWIADGDRIVNIHYNVPQPGTLESWILPAIVDSFRFTD
jgi:hypothetical protein